MRSSVSKRLKEGDRDIEEAYISHCRYQGKQHAGLRQRRMEELEKLFIKDTVAVLSLSNQEK